MLNLDESGREALLEWDAKLGTEKLTRRFYTCTDTKQPVLIISIWQEPSKDAITLELVLPLGEIREVYKHGTLPSKKSRSNYTHS